MGNQVSFTPYEIKDCLFDTERTANLKKAICEQIKEGDIVLEAGGGTGILSMYALQCGAKHAYIIELSPRFCNIIRKVAKANGFEDRVTVICGDATSTDVPEKVDLYIAELLCTGLFFEPQIQAYNNLRRFFKPTTKCIPLSVTSTIALSSGETNVDGVRIDVDSYVAKNIFYKVISDEYKYMDVQFNGGFVDPDIACSDGIFHLHDKTLPYNSVVITTTAMLSLKFFAGATNFLFNPELIFFNAIPSIEQHYVNSEKKFVLLYTAGCDTLDIYLRIW